MALERPLLTKILGWRWPGYRRDQIERQGEIGYLPQDPRSGDPEESARDRILNARGLGTLLKQMAETTDTMASAQGLESEKAMIKYTKVEERFQAAGGYAAEAAASAIASNLGIEERILSQAVEDTLRRTASSHRACSNTVFRRANNVARRAN
jgi:ATPase subunit of ABC transporter with duplicated ATPase domains